MRAGWEEAGILWRRKDLNELIAAPDTDPKLKETFTHVLRARDFALAFGLKPDQSFTQYSEIDRDVLVWVLSASPKTSLTPKTWWFPIVGRVPYKGFFEKEDGIKEAQGLKDDGYDIFLRPSPAFSTLGWFNDPLLSTMKHYDPVALVNTVIHEILHNTVWIPGHVSFNESLANTVGSVGAIAYFRQETGPDSEYTKLAESRWHDEQIYAKYLEGLLVDVEKFYAEQKKAALLADPPASLDEATGAPAEVLTKREALFAEARQRWVQLIPTLKNPEYRDINKVLNNAVLIAQRIYLDRIWVFTDLLRVCNNSIPCLVKEVREVKGELEKNRSNDPYTVLLNRIETLKVSGPENS